MASISQPIYPLVAGVGSGPGEAGVGVLLVQFAGTYAV